MQLSTHTPHKRERKQVSLLSLLCLVHPVGKQKKKTPQYRIVFRVPTNSRRARAATQAPSNTTGWGGGGGRIALGDTSTLGRKVHAYIPHDSPYQITPHACICI